MNRCIDLVIVWKSILLSTKFVNFKMSLKKVYDIALHLQKFRNIDLYKQGMYCLKLQLVAESGVKTSYLELHSSLIQGS